MTGYNRDSTDDLCECVICGRMHRRLGNPPYALSHKQICRLSVLFQRGGADLSINSEDYKINEFLKGLLTQTQASEGKP